MMANGVVPSPPARPLRHAVLRGCLVGAVLAGGLHALYVFLGPNFHTVLPGRVYRCAQLDAPTLTWFIKHYHVRTVLNLRGCSEPLPWYRAECRTTGALEVSQEDVGLSAGRLPPAPAVRHLIEILDRSERPLLVHCSKGIDRTGMVATMALLLYTDAGLDEARGQLGPAHGHVTLGRTGNIDRFFDLYAEWLASRGLEHSRDHFRRWAEHDYCPGECRAVLEVLEPAGTPLRLPRDRPAAIRVRCTNAAVHPWVMRPETVAGVHCRFLLSDADDVAVADGLAGLFHAVVPPGGSIDLTLALTPVRAAGRYVLRIDMVDGQGSSFYQFGAEPLFVEVEVP
jgi:hypothetical protein